MKRLIEYTFFCLLFSCNFSLAWCGDVDIKITDVVIDGRIVDSVLNLSGEKQRVIISISSFAANASIAPSQRYTLETDSNHYFKLIIPSPAARFYMQIRIEPTAKNYWSGFIDNTYILEQGDRISCKLSNSYFEFSGKGADKLNCQSAIYKIKNRPSDKTDKLISEGKWSEFISQKNKELDSILGLRLIVVNKFAPNLGSEMTDIMMANCYGLRNFSWLRTELAVSAGTPSRFLELIKSSAFKDVDRNLETKLNPSTLIASPIYSDFLYQYFLLDSRKLTEGKPDRTNEKYKRLYEKIKSNSSGLMREKLLTTFFLNYKVNEYSYDLLIDAIEIVRRQDFKKLLLEMKSKRGKGNDFFPFELIDNKGNLVKLSAFMDKVFLIDFWFTGCIPCRELNKAMDPVYTIYKNNPNIKFISVNVDADKSKWFQSLNSGDYTHPGYINLYAGAKEKGVDTVNKLIKYYDIKAYPTLFLIKDGKIYDANPPRPLQDDLKDPNNGSTQQLISLINQALKN